MLPRKRPLLPSSARRVWSSLLFWSLASVSIQLAVAQPQETGFEKWEQDIARFEQHDREYPPQPGGVVFVGSSSIRKWDLSQSFPEQPIHNRGFGGSEIADATHFADRVLVPLKPAMVVLYAGDNDINSGKSAAQVAEDFQQFVQTLRKPLPDVTVVFITIKPSPARWKLWETMAQANRQIKELCLQDPGLHVADIATPMLNAAGEPRAELFVEDRLHLNRQGYQVWTEVLLPLLPKPQVSQSP